MEWDLTRIFASREIFEKHLSGFEAQILTLGNILAIASEKDVESFEDLLVRFERLSSYIDLQMAKDQNDGFCQDAQRQLASIHAKLSALENSIETDDNALSIIAQNEALTGYHRKLSKKKERSASAEKEKLLLSLGVFNSSNWHALHKMTNQNARTAKGVSFAEAKKEQRSADWPARQQGAMDEIELCQQTGDIAARALFAIKSENLLEATMHGYSSVLAKRLDEEGLAEDFFWETISQVTELAPMLRECLLKRYAQTEPYTPHWVNQSSIELPHDKEISLEAAHTLIKNAAAFLGADMANLTDATFTKGLVDSELLPGKRTGAFCENVYDLKATYVSVNYSGSINNFISLAHELGHSLHYSLLNTRPYLVSCASISLKEGFAQFFELLALEELVKAYPEFSYAAQQKEIVSLCTSFLEVYSRFLFEDEFFSLCRLERQPSVDAISAANRQAQEAAFGSLPDDAYSLLSWVNKPHFYYPGRPYYNYPYIIGRLLSYQMLHLASHGTGKTDELLNLLSAGDNLTLQETIAKLFEIGGNSSWKQAVSIIKTHINEYLAESPQTLHEP